MSRIYRSLDLQRASSETARSQRSMGATHSDRPAGGFCNASACAAPRQETAEERACRMVEDAKRQAEVVQRDAYHAGFEQGERAGEKLAQQKLEPAVQLFQSMLEALRTERSQLIARHEQELIRIALAIAARVVRKTVELDPEVVSATARAALEKVRGAENLVLHVSPKDRQLLEQQLQQHGLPEGLTVVADEEVGRGGCRVECDLGAVDATIMTQFEILRDVLWES